MSEHRRVWYGHSAVPGAVLFSKSEDPATWYGEDPPFAVWVGTPRIARFLARWLNRLLDWWRNW